MTVSYFPPGVSTGIEPGAYVTDGYHLFAILSVAEGSRHEPLVTYEDCRTLELLVCPVAELQRRHLDLVRAAPPGGAG
ncbi:MAG TPA: hypothetical protein VEB65_00830 [Solirubrobacterales bacterium]|nr:hypothetical protein [Solirubrobacterales bacterium]